MSGCHILGDAEFDYLVNMLTIRALHFKGSFPFVMRQVILETV